MTTPRNDNFAERRQAALDAKKALLDKLKAGKKPATANADRTSGADKQS